MYYVERITINSGWFDTTPIGYEDTPMPLMQRCTLFETPSLNQALRYWNSYCLQQSYQDEFTVCDIAQSYYRIIKVEE